MESDNSPERVMRDIAAGFAKSRNDAVKDAIVNFVEPTPLETLQFEVYCLKKRLAVYERKIEDEKLKTALEVADKCRALTEPSSYSDYGVSLDLKISLMPHLAVLAAAYLQIRSEKDEN